MQKRVLTKFTKYREGLFSEKAGIKISLPNEFNDAFDSQLRLFKDDVQKLVIEAQKINPKINQAAIEYYIERLQTVHVLSLINGSASSFNTTHMWGLYAEDGKGIALEFDYDEMENRFNYKLLQRFQNGFINSNDTFGYLRSELNENILPYLQEFLRGSLSAKNLELRKVEELFLNSNCSQIKENKSLLDLLIEVISNQCIYNTDNLEKNLIEVKYHHRFDILHTIFKKYLNLLIKNADQKNQDCINSTVNRFFSFKHTIWRSEQEYRLIIPNNLMNIIRDIEKQNGFNDKSADFVQAKAELIEKRKGINVLNYATKFELGYERINLGAAPFCKSLPFPKRIYLGWAFKKYGCTKCKTTTQEYNTIINFCKAVQEKHDHCIELYSLDEKVDYKNNSFIIRKEYPFPNNL